MAGSAAAGSERPVRLIAAEDVRRLAAAGATTIETTSETIVTPEARDVARARGIALTPREAAPPAAVATPPAAAPERPAGPPAPPAAQAGTYRATLTSPPWPHGRASSAAVAEDVVQDVARRVAASLGGGAPDGEVVDLVRRALRDAEILDRPAPGDCRCPHL